MADKRVRGFGEDQHTTADYPSVTEILARAIAQRIKASKQPRATKK